jgi:hypothetical protein
MRKAEVPEGSGDEPRLVFEKDGDQYVLIRVLDPGLRFGIEALPRRPDLEPERTRPSTD